MYAANLIEYGRVVFSLINGSLGPNTHHPLEFLQLTRSFLSYAATTQLTSDLLSHYLDFPLRIVRSLIIILLEFYLLVAIRSTTDSSNG
jgi:hypothetical protein